MSDTCKNCGKPIDDEVNGFCPSADDRCWHEWLALTPAQSAAMLRIAEECLREKRAPSVVKSCSEVRHQLQSRRQTLAYQREHGDDPKWTAELQGSVDALCWVLGLPTAEQSSWMLCSFCGKSQREVKKLITGPTVLICDECIGLCNDILGEEPKP